MYLMVYQAVSAPGDSAASVGRCAQEKPGSL